MLLAPFTYAGCASEGKTTVPNVVPNYVQNAIANLHHAGLRALIVAVPPIAKADLSVNGYAVSGQKPRAGTRVARGSEVRLTIAVSVNGGPGGLGKSGRVTVPKLTDLGVNRAITLAGESGLRATVVIPGRDLEDLVVRSQSLIPGTRVQAGTEIRLAPT